MEKGEQANKAALKVLQLLYQAIGDGAAQNSFNSLGPPAPVPPAELAKDARTLQGDKYKLRNR